VLSRISVAYLWCFVYFFSSGGADPGAKITESNMEWGEQPILEEEVND